MVQKILKGLLLAAVFGGIVFLITKDMGTAGLVALVMFMSMFVRSREEKIESVIEHSKKSKK